MRRDKGPIHNLGFGVTSRDLGAAGELEEGPDPNGGFIAKALYEHPVMRFFAASAATVVGAVVAGRLIKKGGLKLGAALQEAGHPFVTKSFKDLRYLRDQMDNLQGVHRAQEAYLEQNKGRLFWEDTGGHIRYKNKVYTDGSDPRGGLTQIHGWYETPNEIARAKDYIDRGVEPPTTWTLKDELVQRMTLQARRLPYELPAAYIAQRGITDTFFGTAEEKKVDWSNPLDVVSDIVTQSAFNAAFMFSPLEAGTGGTKHAWRKMMTYGDNIAGLTPVQRSLFVHATSLRNTLADIGHDSGKLINRAIEFSSRSTGAFSAAIKASNENQIGLVDAMRALRHGSRAALADVNAKEISKVEKWSEKASEIGNLQSALDMMPGHPIDFLPGPFRGLHSAYKAGKAQYANIREQQKALKNLSKKGRAWFDQASDVEKTHLNEALQGGASPVDELMDTYNRMAYGPPVFKNGRLNHYFKSGEFYQSRVTDLYNTKLRKALGDAGLSVEDIDTFHASVAIASPVSGKAGLARFTMGGKALQGVDAEDIYAQMAIRLGVSKPARFAEILPQAMDQVDEVFKRGGAHLSVIDKQIEREWAHIKSDLFPRMGESVLGKAKLPYRLFEEGSLNVERRSFLARKTAEQTGLRMRNEVGDIVSDDIVSSHLKRFGYDPANTGQLRAYLTRSKQISAPWNKDGLGFLGFKPITIDSALERSYFGVNEARDTEIRDFIRSMRTRDPVSDMGQYKVGGLYESAHGEVVDLNVVRRGLRKFTDRLANDFQIPLVHIQPFKTVGFSEFAGMRQRPMVQYIPGSKAQPFLDKGEAADFHIWSRAGAKGSKGNVSAFGWENNSIFKERILPGKYRPIDTSRNTIGALQAKIAAGDMGFLSRGLVDDSGNLRGAKGWDKFKKFFNISDYQPDSVFGWAKRFRGRKTDINNPVVFAKLLRGETISHRGQNLKLDRTTWEVKDISAGASNVPVNSQREVAEVFDRFSDLFKKKGIPSKLESDDFGGDLFTQSIREEKVSLSSQKSLHQLLTFAEDMTAEHGKVAPTLSKQRRESMKRAHKLLVARHLRHGPTAAYWDSAVPGVSGTISTRVDQFRSDIQEYMIISKGLMSGDQSFATTIADLTSRLDRLKMAGQISQAQYVEARAALLGTQLDFNNLAYYSPDAAALGNTIANTHAAMTGLTSGRMGAVASDLLGDTAAGKLDIKTGAGWQGRLGKIEPFFKKRFGTAPYRFAGETYDPFGGTPALVPTFGTAASRNPIAALGGVFGLGTGSNPQAFSGMAIPAGHAIERINKAFGLGGLSLDPTRYSGPLDIYARGIIGQRALPMFGAAAAGLAVDRTLGGLVNDRDAYGERVYSPLVLGKAAEGLAYAQAGLSGIMPGGLTYEERRDQLFEGEVPIKSGRWWPLGNTPWEGGRTQYYRPSWYRRLKSGYSYTDQTYGSPLERLAFGFDFSPLRPLDPYRFERQHYSDRPYPVTGEYFTGPWGPLTSVLNATVGRVIKPQVKMHRGEMESGLSQFLPTGEQGAYFAPSGTAGATAVMGGSYGGGGGGGVNSGFAGPGAGSTGSVVAGSYQASVNQRFSSAGQVSLATGRNLGFGAVSDVNMGYSAAAYADTFGPTQTPGGMMPRVISGAEPTTTRSLGYGARQFGYEAQELLGIYGFASGSIREALGFGNLDMTTPQSVMDSPGRAYGSTRGFWGLGLGGLGDVPTPLEGNMSNLELSEIVRRFVPRERTGTEFVNPISNEMGQQYPWLPTASSGYYLDFSRGDPYTKVPEGEMRLPGKGYERLHDLHPDQFGNYGLTDIHKILGDVAPWSQEYRRLDRLIDSGSMNDTERALVETTRTQVADKAKEHQFTPYEHKFSIPTSLRETVAQSWEKFQHMDTPLHTKFVHKRTALEDWERENVYGTTFPQWQHPIRDYLVPMAQKSTQRNPLQAATILGGTGTLFAKSSQGKVVGATIGAGIGLASSAIGHAGQALTGQRYMPEARRKEVALEEYCVPDITTVLTKRGWLTPYELSLGDEILTINPDTEEVSWEYPKAINTFNGSREMEIWNTRSLHAMSTLDHRWLIRGSGSDNLSFKETRDIKDLSRVFIGSGDFSGVFPVDKIYGDEFVELVGWVMTEGYLRSDYAVEVCQSEKSQWIENIDRIFDFYFDLGLKVTRHLRDGCFVYYFPRIVSDAIRRVINIDNRAIDSSFISNLTVDQAWLLFETCIRADGRETQNTQYFGQSNLDRINSFQMLAALLGMRTFAHKESDEWYDVGIQKRFNTAQLHRHKESRERVIFNGVVWCPTTPNGTWLANYEGCVFWTGNTDILNYVKNNRLSKMASMRGDTAGASEFKKRASRTLYGIDVYNAPIQQIAQAIPKRKREHFMAMAAAPPEEHGQILSTAGRLERRALEAVWGTDVEAKPELEDYFQDHELPDQSSDFWHPNTNIDHVKIKVGQSMGLDMSQMGYYPQQVREANLINPSYPTFGQSSGPRSTRAQLRRLMDMNGIDGDIVEERTAYPGTRLSIFAGVFS